MKKVLLITYRFPPVGGVGVLRNLKYTKYLPQSGWKPTVLTVKPDYFLLQDNQLAKEISQDVEIVRTSCLKLKQKSYSWVKLDTQRTSSQADNTQIGVRVIKNWLRKILKFIDTEILIPDIWIGWLPSAFISGYRTIKKNNVDVILCSGGSFVSFIIGFLLSKLFKIPIVLDYRDGWTLNTARETSQNNFIKNSIDRYIENKILKHAKKVIYPSKQLMEGYFNNFDIGLQNKSYVITNGYDSDDFRHFEKVQQKKFTIAHIGSCDFEGRKWIVMKFLDIVKIMIRDNPDLKKHINFLFIGVIPVDVIRKINDHDLSDIITTGNQVDYKSALNFMHSSNALLLLVDYCKRIEFILSNKLFDYLKIGRPIIMFGPKNGASAEILKHVNVGKIIDYMKLDNETMADNLNLYITQILNGKIAHQPNSKAIERYSRKNLTERLANILSDAIS